jgi:hypothetical protein
MTSATAYAVRDDALSCRDVITLTASLQEDKISSATPDHPRYGELYIYDHSGSGSPVRDYFVHLDSLRWNSTGGWRTEHQRNPIVRRRYFTQATDDTPNDLTRVVLEVLKAGRKLIIVHYRRRASTSTADGSTRSSRKGTAAAEEINVDAAREPQEKVSNILHVHNLHAYIDIYDIGL